MNWTTETHPDFGQGVPPQTITLLDTAAPDGMALTFTIPAAPTKLFNDRTLAAIARICRELNQMHAIGGYAAPCEHPQG